MPPSSTVRTAPKRVGGGVGDLSNSANARSASIDMAVQRPRRPLHHAGRAFPQLLLELGFFQAAVDGRGTDAGLRGGGLVGRSASQGRDQHGVRIPSAALGHGPTRL